MEGPPLGLAKTTALAGIPTAADTSPQVPAPVQPDAQRQGTRLPDLWNYYYQNYGANPNRSPLTDATMNQLPRIISQVDTFLRKRTNNSRRFEPDSSLVDKLFNVVYNEQWNRPKLPATLFNAQVMADRVAADVWEQLESALLDEWRYHHYVIERRQRQKVSLFPQRDGGPKDEHAWARRLSTINPNLQPRRERYLQYIGAKGLPYPVTTY